MPFSPVSHESDSAEQNKETNKKQSLRTSRAPPSPPRGRWGSLSGLTFVGTTTYTGLSLSEAGREEEVCRSRDGQCCLLQWRGLQGSPRLSCRKLSLERHTGRDT